MTIPASTFGTNIHTAFDVFEEAKFSLVSVKVFSIHVYILVKFINVIPKDNIRIMPRILIHVNK